MLHRDFQGPARRRALAERASPAKATDGISLKAIIVAAATTIGFSSANAAVATVQPICEPGPGGVNTVNVRLTSYDLLEYSFRRLPSGPILVFSPGVVANSAKFALAAGTYRLTYRNPSFSGVAAYPTDVEVKPYKVVNGACAVLRPIGRSEAVREASH